ncbi:MAG: zinc ribbon domain-containing protein [Clostridia bacterium]|nr:zinc ribbon domain-containing protein [Clostridia bacterium]
MKYCSTCGAQLHDDAVICVKCGCPTVPLRQTPADENSLVLNVLSFFVPLLGLICYLVFANTQPVKAHGCGRFALTGFAMRLAILGLFLILLSF